MTDAGECEAVARHDALAGRSAATDAAQDDRAPTPSELFARRRIELGLSLEDVANQLKFSARQIAALEAGDFEKLPGGTFARGMMRSYARLLKIEPGRILEQLAAAGGTPQVGLERAVSLRAPIPFSEGGKHVNLLYAIFSLLLLAVVAFFAIQWYQEKSGPGKLAFVRPVTVVASGTEAPGRISDAPPGAALPPTAAPESATLASAGAPPMAQTTASAAERAAERIVAKAAAIPVAGVPAVTSIGPGKRRIVLRFELQSWVEIKGTKGVILMSQLNPPGTEKVIEGDPPFDLTIGNANGVRLNYNDQPVDLRPYFHVDVARLTLN